MDEMVVLREGVLLLIIFVSALGGGVAGFITGLRAARQPARLG